MKFVWVLVFGIICVGSQTNAASRNGFKEFSEIRRNTFDLKVIGGSNAKRRQFPYMAALHNRGIHWCGASVASRTWVITAAHCCDRLVGFDCSQTQVIAGQLLQFEEHPDVQKSLVAKVVVHPKYFYNGTSLDHDITLLKLATSLVFTIAVQPVKLPSAMEVFTKGWLSGWGVYKRPSAIPVTLQYLQMDIITNDECEDILKNLDPSDQLPLVDSMVCAMPPSGGSETGCNGDSGGPLAEDGTLVGVTSWAIMCHEDEVNGPTVYTDVRKHLDFIREHVKDLSF